MRGLLFLALVSCAPAAPKTVVIAAPVGGILVSIQAPGPVRAASMLATIESMGLLVDVPCDGAGRILRTLAAPGDQLAAGAPLAEAEAESP